MMSPSALAVFALKFLQKSMILTAWGPSAVPTGGAGVAFPAAIWSFTIACTFFAINQLPATRSQLPARSPDNRLEAGGWKLQLFYLQEIQFDRRRAAENRDHHLERVAVRVDLVHHAVEAGERPLVDPHLVALVERVPRLRLLRRLGHLVQDLVDLFTRQRRRL